MIYPTPNPELPFLGVHYTRRTDGKVIVGPNAVLAFGREAYDNTDVNPRELLETLTYGGFQRLLASPLMLAVAWSELNKSYRKEKFAAASQKLVPEVRAEDLQKSYGDPRPTRQRGRRTGQGPAVRRARGRRSHPQRRLPGLTSSLPFGDHIAERLAAKV